MKIFNYIKINRLLISLIIMLVCLAITFGQSTNENVIKTLNNFRTSNKITEFAQDSTLTKGLSRLHEKNMLKNVFDQPKDSVRKLLGENKFYDYHFEIFNTKLDNKGNINLEKFIQQDDDFKKLMRDSLYNSVAYLELPGEKSVIVIFSQKYIEFLNLITEVDVDNRTAEILGKYNIITGTRKNPEELFYCIDDKHSPLKKEDETNIPPRVKQKNMNRIDFGGSCYSGFHSTIKSKYDKDENYFDIKVPFGESLLFYDKTGKKIAEYLNPFKDRIHEK